MTDNAIDEWLNNAIPPGSGRYYALLHASEASRRRLQAITTLISVWSKLCFSNREIEVAQKKVDWWREELRRNTNRHPVTLELNNALEATPDTNNAKNRIALFEHLEVVLEAYGSLLTSGSPATEKKNKEFHMRTGGTSCLLICNLPEAPLTAQKISDAGILLSRLRCLRYLHAHINNGLMCLPMAELESRDIKPNQFIPGNIPADACRYLTESIDTIAKEIQGSLDGFGQASFNHAESDGAKVIYVYLAQQLRLLDAMKKNVDHLFLPEARLSPLRNYWHAFRAAAKFESL